MHRENDRFEKKRKRQTKIDEETKSHRENARLRMKRNCQDETEEQTKLRRKNNRLNMKRKREAETEDQTKLQRENNKLAMRRKRQTETEEKTANCHAKTEEHKDDMANVINRLKKEAMKFLHRTKDLKNPHKHRAVVCIICNCCIIGTEAIRKLTKEQIFFA